jgi:uncharacterized protein
MSDLFVVTAWDGTNGTALRAEHRLAHFAHFETIIDKFAVAGPLYADDGSFAGSLVVIKAASKEDAEAILKSDPYFKAGVWDRWQINRYLAAAGEWVGGKTW